MIKSKRNRKIWPNFWLMPKFHFGLTETEYVFQMFGSGRKETESELKSSVVTEL